MTKTDTFRRLFPNEKPIFAMIHLSGETSQQKLTLALREIDALIAGGVDAIILENYFGTPVDMEAVLSALAGQLLPLKIGINVLDDDAKAFAFAQDYAVDFIQLDSVAGHLTPQDDEPFAQQLQQWRMQTQAVVLGGVRFKYQPVLSGRSESDDLRLGMTRCDALVVTGEGTGLETDLAKVQRFRAVTGPDFPLLIGAGLTAQNATQQLAVADGAIVGSYLKESHRDTGIISPAHVHSLMTEVAKVREGPRI